MDWKPIKTVPKRIGAVFDIWSTEHGRLVNYKRVGYGPRNIFYEPVDGGVICIRDATHWMIVEAPDDSRN